MKILQKYTNNYELHIKIESDKEFYNCKYKTGLGSSSALVTSLCGSIYALFLYIYIYIYCIYYLYNKISEKKSLDLSDKSFIFFLSQLSHFKAQGKCGSGFDISTAIFGSQIYHGGNKKNITEELDESIIILLFSFFINYYLFI